MPVNIIVVFIYAVLMITIISSATVWVSKNSDPLSNRKGPTVLSMCTTSSTIFNEKNRDVSYMSFSSIPSNSGTVSEYCKSGYDMVKNKCSSIPTTYKGNETFTDPKSIPRFLELCCNNDENQCNDSALQCLFSQSNFIDQDKTMETMYDGSYSSNKPFITQYCDTGFKNILNKCTVPRQGTIHSNIIGSYAITGCIGDTECLVDIYGDPLVQAQTSLTYKNICCNGREQNSQNCNKESLFCTLEGSDFVSKSESLDSVFHRSYGNESIINEWCNQGEVLSNAQCRIVQPLNTLNFSRTCCNGSHDIKDCNSSSRQCLFDSDKFTVKENDISNMLNQPEIWHNNKDIFNSYCDAGKSLETRNCIHKNPLSSGGIFPAICCNNSTDINNCNESAMNCLYNSSLFKDKDQYMSSQADQAMRIDGTVAGFVRNNLDMTNEYCAVGNSLLTDGCTQTLVKPMLSSGFKNFCCNGSSNPADCKSTVSPCLSIGSTFISDDATISGVPLGNMNVDATTNYCNNGISLLSNNCATNPISVSYIKPGTSHTTFQDLCCGGTTTPSRCTLGNGGLNCSIDANTFHNYTYSLDSMGDSTSAFMGSIDNIRNMCGAGSRLTSNGCQNYDPKSKPSYVKYCCNGNTSTCNDTSIQCTSDLASFLDRDANYKNMTGQSQIKNNLNSIKTTYCDVGYRMINNGCDTIKVMTDTFKRLCCNNSSTPGQCPIQSSFQCTIDGSNFADKDVEMSLALDTGSQKYLDQYKNYYCDLGKKIISGGCKTVQPSTYRYFSQFCGV